MIVLKKVLFYLIAFVSILIISGTLLSLLYNVNVWWIKTLDFPRLQFFLVGLVCLLGLILINRRGSLGVRLLIGGLLISTGIQAYFIYSYTRLVRPAVPSAGRSDSAAVRLLVANVYMPNRQAAAFLDRVEQVDPDMILVMETDRWWINALQPLRQRYAYHQEYPADNTYGMGLYSRYPLIGLQTRFLQHDSVPSFHTQVQLPNGQTFRLHGVHPVPPVLSKHPDNKGEQEVALIKVGRIVAEHGQPAIVAGDFNDVAWSNTSRLFQTEGQLNDIRVGRGMYSSFDATSPVLRWPLDHVYVTSDFSLISFQRLDEFGSDHFPIYVELELTTQR